MILTLTPHPDRYSVGVAVTGAAVGERLTVEATPLGRSPYLVRFIGGATGPAVTTEDEQAPFGVPITYTVTGSVTPGVVSETIDGLDVTGSVLSSTVRPGAALPVRVNEDRPQEWEARSVWHDVIDRRDPLVTVSPMRYRSGEWLFAVVGASERATLLALLTTGEPMLLRSSCPERVDDVIALPLSMSMDPVMAGAPEGTRILRITYQAVTRPLAPYAGTEGWTYGQLDAGTASYAIVLDDFATYTALYAGPPAALVRGLAV